MGAALTPHRLLALLSTSAALAACKPSVGQPPHLITETTLLAVLGDPPDARPGASVTYSFLLASPSGTVTDAEAMWDICLTPKPPSESNAVTSACVGVPDGGASATGQTFTAAIPSKSCQLFGPIAPPPTAGQPAVRPRDPDSTGGYYLPVQVFFPSLSPDLLSGFALERIMCGLANAPATRIQEYNNNYLPNKDPAIDHTDLLDAAGQILSLDAGVQTVQAGSVVTIQTTFASGSSESFPVYEPKSEDLVPQQETLRVSWFVTGGTFAHDRTGVAAGDSATSTSNQWTAPDHAGPFHLWLVLRDSRGGASYKTYQVQVVL